MPLFTGINVFSFIGQALGGIGDWMNYMIDPLIDQMLYDRIFMSTRDAAINAFEDWISRTIGRWGEWVKNKVVNSLLVRVAKKIPVPKVMKDATKSINMLYCGAGATRWTE